MTVKFKILDIGFILPTWCICVQLIINDNQISFCSYKKELIDQLIGNGIVIYQKKKILTTYENQIYFLAEKKDEFYLR